MNILLDLSTAYALFTIINKRNFLCKIAGIILFISLTLSGIIEHAPYVNSQPTVYYADYSESSLARSIQLNAFPQATIVGKDAVQIQLAGKKLFVGASAGPSVDIKKEARAILAWEIERSKSGSQLCSLIGNNPVDYVEFTTKSPLYNTLLSGTVPHFTAFDAGKHPVLFVNTSVYCHIDN